MQWLWALLQPMEISIDGFYFWSLFQPIWPRFEGENREKRCPFPNDFYCICTNLPVACIQMTEMEKTQWILALHNSQGRYKDFIDFLTLMVTWNGPWPDLNKSLSLTLLWSEQEYRSCSLLSHNICPKTLEC